MCSRRGALELAFGAPCDGLGCSDCCGMAAPQRVSTPALALTHIRWRLEHIGREGAGAGRGKRAAGRERLRRC